MDKNKVILILFLGLLNTTVFCQDFNLRLTVKDSLRTDHVMFYSLMVYNTNTKKAVMGEVSGKVVIPASYGDTLKLNTMGYGLSVFMVSDSVMTLDISSKMATLKTVTVQSQRTLEELQEARSTLTLENTRTVTGLGVLKSPITALYEQFSKREKAKRYVAQMEYNDRKNEILQELFALYAGAGILLLDDHEFEDFIIFMNISDDLLKNLTDYYLSQYIKSMFNEYRRLNDYYFE